jgi:sigma-E factor negative regulatory protein RseA
MKSRISALMDGELGGEEAPETLEALAQEGEARDAWRAYHLISDALRDTRLVSQGFSRRVAARIADEPTVVAPGRLPVQPRNARWFALSAAASVAAVALVGWLAFAPQHPGAPLPELAASARPAAPPQAAAGAQAPAGAAAQSVAAAPKEAAHVPPPSTADDYLLAHQRYSPRNSLQGVAPYVRTVSGETVARKK